MKLLVTVLQAVVDGCVVVGTDPAFWFTITLRQERQIKEQIICNGREHMSGNTQKSESVFSGSYFVQAPVK